MPGTPDKKEDIMTNPAKFIGANEYSNSERIGSSRDLSWLTASEKQPENADRPFGIFRYETKGEHNVF